MSAKDGIGGYIGLEQYTGNQYHCGIALDSARSCLKYDIRLRGISSIRIPDYLCSAVREACEDEHVNVRTYCVGEDFLPIYDFKLAADEWLYLTDYYGQLKPEDVGNAFSFAGGKLVIDEAQGFFREPWAKADTIYTCRKFFGVADGAYLCTWDGKRLSSTLEKDRSTLRMGQVLGRVEDGSTKWFYASQENEAHFEHGPVLLMSAVTTNLLQAVDYGLVCKIREDNWSALDNALSDSNMLPLVAPQGPYMYPYLIENADEVRKRMAVRGVFIPMLWPNVPEECEDDVVASRYSKNILPLPVDQRYGLTDMAVIINCLKEVLETL